MRQSAVRRNVANGKNIHIDRVETESYLPQTRPCVVTSALSCNGPKHAHNASNIPDVKVKGAERGRKLSAVNPN